MEFLDKYWKKNHILSVDKHLFLYEFQDKEKLNFAIAQDAQNEIIGLFGFIKYNFLKIPDLAGSLWKVRDDCTVPLLGLKLRDFVIKNVPHRFFAAPGAGIQTKPIYQIIKMNWNRMEQYFLVNDTIDEYKVLKTRDKSILKTYKAFHESNDVVIELAKDISELQSFVFDDFKEIVPFKDLKYIEKRFVNYPIYKYDIYTVKKSGLISNIFICRTAAYLDRKVYRIVDFYGDERNMGYITNFLYKYIVDNHYEYCDFISYGFEDIHMLNAGFDRLDFESEDIIVPNFFEPFVQKNISVFCVSDKTDGLKFRQCKADGDQDRPNYVSSKI
ncbi:hypothetical protein [Sulfurimonas sp. HSL-1716]|uniref:hypothetical protein n=1 Tax=Hydrocurvibacter sulfurireducens TaxID=3131937 RepID=UPI0031F76EAF